VLLAIRKVVRQQHVTAGSLKKRVRTDEFFALRSLYP